MLKPLRPDQYLDPKRGSKFNLETYKVNVKKSFFSRTTLNATISQINMQTAPNDLYSKLLKPWPLDQHLGPKSGSNFIKEIYRELHCYNNWSDVI